MKQRKLSELLADMTLLECNGDLNVSITGISYDSRTVEPGHLFVAVRGAKENGLDYIDDAVGRGAVAVLSGVKAPERIDIPWVTVVDERSVMARLACRFWDVPIDEIQVIGITGTNGKTTVTGLISAILGEVGQVARVGTLGMNVGDLSEKTSLTSPEACDLFAFLAKACEKEMVTHLVMEVSSVALVQRRLAGINFDQAIFTSFSGDHLDFHGDMENYFSAKMNLFRMVGSDGWAILNYDDSRASQIIENIDCSYLTYGFSADADIHPLKTDLGFDITRIELLTPRGVLNIVSPLIGRVNVYNIMAAVASAQICGMSAADIEGKISAYGPVRGRLEMVCRKPVQVMVDYAHTDDALRSMLSSVKEVCSGKVILVFGAGGNRDQTKRPRMAAVVARHADWVILTNDNPRKEDPQEIAEQIMAGFPSGFKNFEVELDRRLAITRAMKMAKPGDLVVVAGKGHEDYQIFADRTEHFDDREIILENIKHDQ